MHKRVNRSWGEPPFTILNMPKGIDRKVMVSSGHLQATPRFDHGKESSVVAWHIYIFTPHPCVEEKIVHDISADYSLAEAIVYQFAV